MTSLPTMPPWHVQENKRRAARYGLDAEMILDADSNERLVTDDLDELLNGWNPSRPRWAVPTNCPTSRPSPGPRVVQRQRRWPRTTTATFGRWSTSIAELALRPSRLGRSEATWGRCADVPAGVGANCQGETVCCASSNRAGRRTGQGSSRRRAAVRRGTDRRGREVGRRRRPAATSERSHTSSRRRTRRGAVTRSPVRCGRRIRVEHWLDDDPHPRATVQPGPTSRATPSLAPTSAVEDRVMELFERIAAAREVTLPPSTNCSASRRPATTRARAVRVGRCDPHRPSRPVRGTGRPVRAARLAALSDAAETVAAMVELSAGWRSAARSVTRRCASTNRCRAV